MITSQEHRRFEELDYREANGIEVSLLWNRDDDTLSVYVCDTKGLSSFELDVDPAEALEVFAHPFAYRECRCAVA